MLAANQTADADAAASAAAVQVTNPMSLESIIRLPPSPLFSNYPIWKRGERGKVNQHVASSHTYKKKPFPSECACVQTPSCERHY